jgi:hypothetical protein
VLEIGVSSCQQTALPGIHVQLMIRCAYELDPVDVLNLSCLNLTIIEARFIWQINADNINNIVKS